MGGTAFRVAARNSWRVLALLSLLAGVMAPTGRASAEELGCTQLQEIIVSELGSGSYSTSNTIPVVDRGLTDNCSKADAYSAARVRNTTNNKFAEVGWHEYHDTDGVTHLAKAFWLGNDGTAQHGNTRDGPDVGTGTFRWQVQYITGDGWKFYYDDTGTGSHYVRFGPDGEDLGFSHGFALGYTGRVGGTGTGASDHPTVLKHKGSSGGTSVDWGDQDQEKDTISNWRYDGSSFDPVQYSIIGG